MPTAISGRYARLQINNSTLYARSWRLTTSAQEENVTVVSTAPLNFVPAQNFVPGLTRAELSFEALWSSDDNPYYGPPRLIAGNQVTLSLVYQVNNLAADEELDSIPNNINGWDRLQLLITRVEETGSVRDLVIYSVSGVIVLGYLTLSAFARQPAGGDGEQIFTRFSD